MKNTGAAMKRLIDGFVDVLFPPLCPCCGAVMVRGEAPMCLSCRMKMPLTADYLTPRANSMVDKLVGRVPLERAAAYFTYRRESAHARLIHDAKYRGRPDVGRLLAREFAALLAGHGFFDGIDAVAPVPLNFWRLCSRGYNQSAYIARGVADETGLRVIDALRARRHGSQTERGAEARRRAVAGIYSARPGALDGIGHLLLVDDICTTGSTLYACMEALHSAAPALKISVLALASTARV